MFASHHALLESPTGTGKSLPLLCSALSWQKNHRSKYPHSNLSHPKHIPGPGPTPNPGPTPDPFAFGGGFVPEPEPSGNLISGNSEQSSSMTNNLTRKKRTTPTIYYASRTHSQISQVIREYRKTSYRVPMAVLASRKHYCTNKRVCTKENVDEECKLLLKDPDVSCYEFKNVHKVKNHPSFQKGGCHEAHDIEDLVRVGREMQGCSYFTARAMAADAQLVFCPYSYIINPIVRRAMEVDIKGAIVILDEAHNIEDIARDAGSLDVEEEILDRLQTELGQLCLVESVAMIYQPLYDMIQGIISWIGQKKDNLKRHEFEHYYSCWTGDKALSELQEAGISQQCFPILQECATKAIKAASDTESGGVYLSGMSAVTLEGLFSSLSYIFSREGLHALDYQLALQRYVKRGDVHAASGWTHSLSLWCFNPAIVFKEIADLSLSVILTSGTLSPMSSFASELGVQFEACMEAPHVIDVESQLWAAVISNGPGNCPLNASYKTADGYAFQDALGASLEAICKTVPGGALVFFPSYKLLEKLCKRWVQTGQWSHLNAQKHLFVEPRGSQDDFDHVLKGYYNSICGKNRTSCLGLGSGKLRRGQKREFKHSMTKDSPQNVKGGAAFLAVCRGKVSEGIDFSDENARVVVIVGIPFPNKNDIQVVLKKKYNDTFKSSKKLLSGSQWYCHQAFRALNQAAGRCIRHRFDYGAVILLDERFKEERNIEYISKWLRKSIKQYDNFDKSMEGLQTFFLGAQERFSNKGINVMNSGIEHSDAGKENMPLKNNVLQRGTPRKRNNKINKLDGHSGRKVASEDIIPTAKTGELTQFFTSVRKDSAPLSQFKSQVNVEAEAFVHTQEKDVKDHEECTELKCSPQKDSRWLETVSMASSNSTSEQHIVTEDPTTSDNTVSYNHLSKEQNSHSTVVQATSQISDQLSFHSVSITNSIRVLSEGASPLAVTPERKTVDVCNHELESSLNLSVNSHSLKRRKPVGLHCVAHTQMNISDFLSAESSPHVNHLRSTNRSRDGNQDIDLAFEANCAECKHQKLNVPEMTAKKNCGGLCTLSDPIIEKKLYICCSICGNPLGLRENNFLVLCSLTSSSKIYLATLLRNGSINTCSPESLPKNQPTSVPVLISNISSVDQRLCDRCTGGAPPQGIWCEEDGCVFRTVSCPFCTVSVACLGVQIMATDSSNIHLLNKIFFFVDRVNIKNQVAASQVEVLLPVRKPDLSQVSNSASIEQYAFVSQQKNSRGSSTTKSKLRLPKRGLVCNSEENQYGSHV
ncbi:RAD3-like DNA-binding helicase protein isoform X2 [Tasmannia lanceolata]|uniref:RAD3-like DNA-binding helicase protein isoform X2 n=1 Tax=Tasmannia lanceolata TaxID=3420 RepID=UPI0040638DE8